MSAAGDVLRGLEQVARRLTAAGTAEAALCLAAWRPASAPLGLPVLLDLARGLPHQVGVDAGGLAPDTVFPPATGRVVLNLLLLAAEAQPRGGTIRLAGSAADLFLRLDGPGAAWPAGLAVWARDRNAARAALVSEAGFQGGLTALLAAEAGLGLSFVMPPTRQTAAPLLRLLTR